MSNSHVEEINAAKNSKNILKATFILGSSSVFQMALTIIRTKILAILLGPAGVGLAGLLNTLMTTAGGLFDLGSSNSATRSVAEANSKADRDAIGQIRTVVTLLSIILGVVGCLVVFFAAKPLAALMLGSTEQSYLVQIVSVGVLFTITAGVQGAFINGMRRIGDMARITVIGNVLGTIISVFIAWQFRSDGIIYYVIAVPLITLLVTLIFLVKVSIPYQLLKLEDFIKQSRIILKLGIPMMISGLVGNAMMLIVRGRIANKLGLEAVGLFQVAWAISGIYIGFVLSAMAKEYYPRLTGMIDSLQNTNQAVNDQAKLSIWIITPLLLGVAALAPFIVHILYTSEFLPVVGTLRWMALGTVLKVLTWAMGFIWLARGMGRYVLIDALLWCLFFSVGIILALEHTGVEGIGWIYTLSYIFAITYTRIFVGKITGFKFQRSVLMEACLLFFACLLCIILNYWLLPFTAMMIGGFLFILLSIRAFFNLYYVYTQK